MIAERKDDMQVRETPPFAPVLMESTRAIGYSLEAAIADIIVTIIKISAHLENFFISLSNLL